MVDGHVVDAAHLEDLKVQLSLKDVEVAKLLNDLQVSVFFKRFLFVADVVAKNYPRFFCRRIMSSPYKESWTNFSSQDETWAEF
jgi:hypothetical protein